MTQTRPARNRWRALAAVTALIAFAGALGITIGYGPGLDPDSMAYVGAATSLARGDGLRVPLGKWETADSTVALTVWPPAFPAAMAVPQTLGAPPLSSARMIIALAAATTAGLIVLLFSGAATLIETAIVTAVVVCTPAFIAVHLSVLSEPLFLASLMLTLYGMSRQRAGVAAAGAAIAVMTRYAGVSAAAAAAVWFLFRTPGSIGNRARRALIASAPAALAFALWMIHNARVAVVQSPIRLSYHPGVMSTIGEGLTAAAGMIAPGAGGSMTFVLALGFVALLAAALVSNVRAGRLAAEPAFPLEGDVAHSAALLLAAYLGVIIASRMFVGGTIEFDRRILSPAFLLGELALAPIFLRALRPSRIGWRVAATAIIAIWIASSLATEGPVVLDSINDGNDFAASDWRESPMIEWVAKHGGSNTIYTNWPAAIYFNAHRDPFDLPTTAVPDTLALFGKRLAEMRGLYAAFDARNADYPSTDSIVSGAGLSLFMRFDDGAVWVKKRP